MYSKTCLKRPLKKKDQKFVFKTNYRLMQVKSIAECSKRAFCNTFDLHYAIFCFVYFLVAVLDRFYCTSILCICEKLRLCQVSVHAQTCLSLWLLANGISTKIMFLGPYTCTVKPVLSSHSKKRPKICFQDQLSLDAGQKYCRMLQGEHPH